MQIAQTILAQLGGNKFIAMTGARYMVATENALHFQLPTTGNKRRINSVVIRLDPSDTYTVLFNRRTNMGVNVTKIDSETGVYADALRATFTHHTGLETSL